MKNWQTWGKGLLSAIIGAGSNAIVLLIADPLTFNLQAGLANLLRVMATSAIVAAAMYLKQSPLPCDTVITPEGGK